MLIRNYTVCAMLIAGILAPAPASAGTLDYDLIEMQGSWAWGNTQWNNVSGAGYVNNSADKNTVDNLFHSTYTYSPPGGSSNAIYNFGSPTASLIFKVVGGLSQLSDLAIFSSRSYSSSTIIDLLVSANSGATWTTALHATTSALGWGDVGTAGTATETVHLNFAGVVGDQFQFRVTGNQINIHTLTLSGTALATPGPVVGAGVPAVLGLMGFAGWRRRNRVA